MGNASTSSTLRFDMNRLVRRVLTRHGANLELISISCPSTIVHLTGSLMKTVKPNYTANNIMLILREIEHIPIVRGIDVNLENLSASKCAGVWNIIMKKQTSSPLYASARAKEYNVEDKEKVVNVYRESNKEKAEKQKRKNRKSEEA
jgi:hypothetical protein